jgi:hypothetical protein
VLAVVVACNQNLGLSMLRLGQHERSRTLLNQALTASVAGGGHRMAAASTTYLSLLELDTGAARAAERYAREAISLCDSWALAHATLSVALGCLGRHYEAMEAAESGMEILGREAVEEGENYLRLAHIDALAEAHRGDTRSALETAIDRLRQQLATIDEPGHRKSFLEAVPENARLVELGRERLGVTIVS